MKNSSGSFIMSETNNKKKKGDHFDPIGLARMTKFDNPYSWLRYM